MRRHVAMFALIISLSSIALPATQQAPPRDAPRLAEGGNASITGTVLADDETRAPLRRAIVSLTRTGLEDIRTTATDERGAFAFGELPAGTYSLRASKGGYLGANYGALQPGMPGSPIAVRDGQRFAAEPIALTRGAVIAGRLLDRYGRPAAYTTVEAVPILMVNGERRRRATSDRSGMGSTNAHGEYRLFGLPPGDYAVFADPQFSFQGATAITPGEIAWAQRPSSSPPTRERTVVYALTVFPGTADLDAAVPIVLKRGEERTGVDFTIQSVPAVRVSGVVTGPDGLPAPNVAVRRVATRANALFATSRDVVGTTPSGTFRFDNVPPGDFTLVAYGAPANAASIPDPTGRGSYVPQTWWGLSEIGISGGNDVTDRAIRLQPGASVRGRIAYKSAGQAAPATPPRVTVTFDPLTPGASAMGSRTANVSTDGSFTIEGLVPGGFRLRATIVASPWAIQSIVHAGQDLLDVPLEIRSGDSPSDVVITLSDQMASLSGTLTDATGRPTPQFYVFMFPVDRRFWTQDSRRVRAVRADVNGVYTVAGLPPGEYYVCAATAIDATLQYDASYLEPFVPAAITLTFGEGEKKTQSLRIGG